MATARLDAESPRRVMGAVKRLRGASTAASRQASAAMLREVEDARREVAARQARLAAAHRALAAARAALQACLGCRGANCAAEAAEVRSAEQDVREAERSLQVGREVSARLEADRERLERARRRCAAAVAQHSEGALRELSDVRASIDAYLAGESPGAGAAGAAGTAPARVASGASSPAPSGGRGFTVGRKVERQMESRGWTRESIGEAVREDSKVAAVNRATGRPATRYVHPTTGKSVVVDDVSGEVIHVGGYGFRYGPGSGDAP